MFVAVWSGMYKIILMYSSYCTACLCFIRGVGVGGAKPCFSLKAFTLELLGRWEIDLPHLEHQAFRSNMVQVSSNSR